MRFVFAILLPWTVFVYQGKVLSAFLSLALQLTLFGWGIAAVWAFLALRAEVAEREIAALDKRVANRHKKTLKAKFLDKITPGKKG